MIGRKAPDGGTILLTSSEGSYDDDTSSGVAVEMEGESTPAALRTSEPRIGMDRERLSNWLYSCIVCGEQVVRGPQ